MLDVLNDLLDLASCLCRLIRKITDLFLWKAVLLGIAIFILQKFFPKLHPVIFIALSAAAGILFHFAGV